MSAPAAVRWQDYLTLLKPRVMSVVVFTAITGFVCAGAPVHLLRATFAVACIALGAGASGALNMWYDADIDRLMRRTRNRPIPAGRTPPAAALAFGLVLAVISVALLGVATNALAAALLAFTIVFYVVVYTMWLKRMTAQNIVIGGLAGALPPAVGWAAASGEAPLNAWLLVVLIFVWTPPHFWSLALLSKEDYRQAGVPMMPNVAGDAATRRQILGYSLVLGPLGLVPAFTGLAGTLYLVVAALAGAAFVCLAVRLERRPSAVAARSLFGYSILYLIILFATLLGERLAAR
jgi:protoheme IX farnesyltransferase